MTRTANPPGRKLPAHELVEAWRWPGGWVQYAACAGVATENFNPWFPTTESADAIQKACEAGCNHCPVAAACLDFALVTNQQDGIWGGLGTRARNRLRKQRRADAIAAERQEPA